VLALHRVSTAASLLPEYLWYWYWWLFAGQIDHCFVRPVLSQLGDLRDPQAVLLQSLSDGGALYFRQVQSLNFRFTTLN
jgi:hypothetical protein